MAVTTEHFYDGNNSTTSFAYTFPYYKTSDIKVKVGGTLKTESTHYNVTGTNIVFTSGNVPPTGTNNIHIYRDTDVDTSKATFAAGSSIRATDLNNNHLQLLYHAQEHDNLIQTGELANAEGKGQLVNANISATAAIAGTKISPNFGAQNIITTGTAATGAATVTGNITVSGTVDGRDVAADGTKLDGIEAGATGDQTNAEIRTAVEAASDSNVFTDADHTKLNAIEASATADQTGAEIKAAYEAESNTNAYTDAEKTKLAAIEASADVTDATNVNAAGAVMNSDLDGKGELLVGDGSGDPSALAVGTNGYILTADSSEATGIKWAANAGGGGSSTFAGLSDTPGSLGSAGQHIKVNAAGNALEFTAAPTGTVTETFKTIAVSGQNSVVADGATDTLTLAAGSNVTITTNDSTDTITIASSGGGGATSTDFKYLELKAHNNASGAFSAGAADYELVTKGTTTAITPAAANALLISIAGVLQEPNTGTSIGSNDGFCIDGSSIHFGANLTAHPDFIIYLQGAGVASIADNTVTSAKIVDGTIVNADINASAAIAGSKLADDSIAEAKLDIHNAPSGTDKYLKYTSNGMEWATAGSGTPEGTAILSTGETGGTKFLREDGDNSCSWQAVPAGVTQENVEDWVGGMVTGNTETGIAVTYDDSDGTLDFVVASEGTAVLSTGETGTTKFLRVDGDNSCSWQVPPDTNTQLSTEEVQDIVGGMVTGNTETGITVTYEDGDGTLDFVVGTLNQDTTGTAAIATTVTVADESGDTTCFPLFVDAATGDLAPKSGSNLTFNSNSGALGATSFAGDGSALTNLPVAIGQITEHKATMTANHTIGTGNNGLVAGPFSTGSYTLTIPSGSTFTVV